MAVKKKGPGSVEVKQGVVFRNLLNSTKHKSAVQARIDAGYSKSYANSGQMKETKAWKRLVEKHLSDKFLMKRHEELLNKKEVLVRGPHNEVVETGELDANAVKAGLDMAYKIKGSYQKDNEQKKSDIIIVTEEKIQQIGKALDNV